PPSPPSSEPASPTSPFLHSFDEPDTISISRHRRSHKHETSEPTLASTTSHVWNPQPTPLARHGEVSQATDLLPPRTPPQLISDTHSEHEEEWSEIRTPPSPH